MNKTKRIVLCFTALLGIGLSAAFKDSPDLRTLYSQPSNLWPAPTVDDPATFAELASLPDVVYPEGNPYSPEKELLGKQLFFDPRLSRSGSIACASCHDPQLGWGDGRTHAFGHERREGKRNAMTILNTAYVEHFFWDGRAVSLEDQIHFPIADTLEMNMPLTELTRKLNGITGYREAFQQVFGQDTITVAHIQQAIATFERSVVSRKSRFDYFLEGKTDILSDEELHGLHLFRTKARCINCHHGALFSDNKFHNNGQSHLGRPTEDLGKFMITGDTADVGKFRTPSLRDVVFTGPYLHHGNVSELAEILEMYDNAMPQHIPKKYLNDPLYPQKDVLLDTLHLTDSEKHDLMAFLGSISTRPRRIMEPALPQ